MLVDVYFALLFVATIEAIRRLLEYYDNRTLVLWTRISVSITATGLVRYFIAKGDVADATFAMRSALDLKGIDTEIISLDQVWLMKSEIPTTEDFRDNGVPAVQNWV